LSGEASGHDLVERLVVVVVVSFEVWDSIVWSAVVVVVVIVRVAQRPLGAVVP
jgi:hypothetical protein